MLQVVLSHHNVSARVKDKARDPCVNLFPRLVGRDKIGDVPIGALFGV